MWGTVLSVAGLTAAIGIVVVLERRRARPTDWLTPTSKLEAAAILATLAAFYGCFLLLVLAPKTPDPRGGPESIDAPYGAIVFGFIVVVFGSTLVLGYRAAGRSGAPKRPRWGGRYGTAQRAGLEMFLPSRLADAGRMLGLPALAVWAFYAALVLACFIATGASLA